MVSRTAIIGAGMAGLACAEQLVAAGARVTLFDKGRGPGGRMSTRRVETSVGPTQFDHGAQYFTVRDTAFAARVDRWRAAGLVASWPGAGRQALVGIPGMNAPIKEMAGRLDVRWATRIDALSGRPGAWTLDSGTLAVHEVYDRIIVAVPPEQAASILAPVAPAFVAPAIGAVSTPCWAVLVTFTERVEGVPDVMRPEHSIVAWAGRDSSKPGRHGPESWVLQTGAEWSRAQVERKPDGVTGPVLGAFAELVKAALPPIAYVGAHRWRYARVDRSARQGCLWQSEIGIGVCGDWLVGPRIECAFVSGLALAREIAR